MTPEKQMKIIGQHVKEARIEKGLTQKKLAKEAGFTNKTSIARIEEGLNTNIHALVNVANALNMDLWALSLEDES